MFPIHFEGFLKFRGSMLGGKIGLGVSWRALGASWRPLGASYGDLGGISGRLRSVWRRVGGVKEPSWGPTTHGRSRISAPLMSSLKGDMEL